MFVNRNVLPVSSDRDADSRLRAFTEEGAASLSQVLYEGTRPGLS